jgi:glycosyltransferase involved in cell wall biosynthesis
MHQTTPLVTVAMPVFNGGRHLRLAVQSIVKQTFADWELLLIDDGSTDGAVQDLADIKDPRIRVLRDGQNRGLAARLNEAIDLARGKYIARMDHDDVSYPERFALQLQAFEKNPSLDLVATQAITIDGKGHMTGCLPADASNEKIVAKPWRGFYLPHPTWMGKTSWFRQFRYTIPAPYLCEDQELLFRSYQTSRFAMVDQPLLAYRIREKTVWSKQFKTRMTVFRVQWRHFVSTGQYGFALISILVLAGRLLLDLRRALRGNKPGAPASSSAKLEKHWQDVLQSLKG